MAWRDFVAALRTDGWENVVLGLGGVKDLSAYTRFAARPRIDDVTLEAIYVEDHFAAKIIEAIVKHALRPGWSLSVPGDQLIGAQIADAFKVYEERLDVATELAIGAFWGRLFGGAITWIGADDGRNPAQPLDESSIASVRWLHTFDRRDVQIYSYYSDPAHPKFQEPEVYRIQPRVIASGVASGDPAALDRLTSAGGALVHETRCVRWPGQPTTDTRRADLQGWDDSILERCWDPLKQLGEDYGAKSMLLGRISQAVYKLKDLFKMIGEKAEQTLRRRMRLLDASRSRAKAIVIDKDEDFVNITQPIGGVPELLDRGALRLAAAADMPVTILMGQSPAGMDATGENDLVIWDTQVAAWRTDPLRPIHERITKLILLANDGPTAGVEPETWSILYRAIRVPTDKQRADTELVWAQTDDINIERGIYPAEVAAFRYAPGAAGIVLDKKELDDRLQRRKELAAQPPKDNAELGTVGARSSAALELVIKVVTGQVSRETGRTLLIELFRFTGEVADKILGPQTFVPVPPVVPGRPGPEPAPPAPGGAGRPPQIPGLNDGGA